MMKSSTLLLSCLKWNGSLTKVDMLKAGRANAIKDAVVAASTLVSDIKEEIDRLLEEKEKTDE